ncbi:hypothetical protein MTATph1_CDS0006 [Moorella phage MTATph1]
MVQQEQVGNKSLVCRIEAIHAGVTKNYTMYSAEELRKSLSTWTTPYNKPVLTHHEIYGEPIGRVVSADFKQSTLSGRECQELVVRLTDAEAIAKILDGRYITVSVGGVADSATCSICGTNWVEATCEHTPGETYDGVPCVAILHGIEFMEVSFVNVPADQDAKVVGIIQEAYLLGDNSIEKLEKPGLVTLAADEAKALLDKFKVTESVSLQETLNVAHQQIHLSAQALGDKPPTDKFQELSQAHAEIVSQMVKAGISHEMVDRLDDALPDDLKPVRQEAKPSEVLPDVKSLVAALALARQEKQAILAENNELKQSLAQVKAENDGLKKQLAEVKQQYENLVGERNQLLETNTAMASRIHSMLVDEVLRIKVEAGKLQPADMETAREEYMAKSDAVLEGILDELKNLSEHTDNITVPDPTLPLEEEVRRDREMALRRLFRGLGRSDNK